MVLVFFVSAVAHEVAVGIPLHMLRGWAFWGIMFQVRVCVGGGGSDGAGKLDATQSPGLSSCLRQLSHAPMLPRVATTTPLPSTNNTKTLNTHIHKHQVPLIYITEALKKRLKSDTWGNYCFWLTFCMIGQPVSLLMYVHDYMYYKGGPAGVAGAASSSKAAAVAGGA
jgi:hypothetical protein